MKVHLTTVYRATQDKKGNPYISKKTNKPYERVSIKTLEHGEKWLSGFGGQWNKDWKEGQEVEVTVKESGADPTGKPYLNFERLDPLEAMESRLSKVEEAVFGHKASPQISMDDSDNLPF